jgi:hypothetical protein
MKHGWDETINDIKSETRNVRNFVMDPDASIDEYGDYMGGALGERIPTTAAKLVEMFPKKEAYITVMVDGKMGTRVVYTEWWNDDYCFYTFKEKVLDKNKNPHFNYEPKEEGEAGNTGEVHNHFAKPKKPYTFMSVFTLGTQPHDITGLIEQNIPNQNLITKEVHQLDYNIYKERAKCITYMEKIILFCLVQNDTAINHS